jgi:hypothetical protein
MCCAKYAGFVSLLTSPLWHLIYGYILPSILGKGTASRM